MHRRADVRRVLQPIVTAAEQAVLAEFTGAEPETLPRLLDQTSPGDGEDDSGCVPFDEYMSCIQNDACRAKLVLADPLTPQFVTPTPADGDELDAIFAKLVSMGVPGELATFIGTGPDGSL